MPRVSRSQLKKKRKDDLVLAKRRIGTPATPEEEEKLRKIDEVLGQIAAEDQALAELEALEKAKASQDLIDQKLAAIEKSQKDQLKSATGKDTAVVSNADIDEIGQWCKKQKEGLEKEKICELGKHDETWLMPAVPPAEVNTEERIKALAATAEDKGAAFEAKAAQYNLAKGHLDENDGGKISRNLTDEESLAGINGNAQKIMLKCSKCTWQREVDHVLEEDGKKVVVEVKNKKSTKNDVDQMKENALFALKAGTRAVYKLPPNRHGDKTRIERVFGELGATVEVILIS